MGIAPRITGRACHGHFQFQQLVVRFEIPIRNWPVRSDSVLRVHFKIRRMKPGRERSPVNGPSSDPFAAIIGAESERIFAAGDAHVFPVKLV